MKPSSESSPTTTASGDNLPDGQPARRKPQRLSWANILLCVLYLLPLASAPNPNTRWCGLDLAQQIATADIVVKASVVSRSAVSQGSYRATFRLDKLLHTRSSEFSSKFLRLKLESPSQSSSSHSCSLAAKVKPETKYLLMVKHIGGGGDGTKKQSGLFGSSAAHALVSPPLRASKKVMRAAKNILCPDCGRERSKGGRTRHSRHNREEFRVVKQENKSPIRLSCSARGNPPPTLYWTMNGRLVNHSPHTKINTKKISKYLLRSVLRLSGPVNSSVRVQCHAYNSYGHTSRVKLKKRQQTKTTTTSTTTTTTTRSPAVQYRTGGRHSRLRSVTSFKAFFPGTSARESPMQSSRCPVDNYCMNGGRCVYYSNIRELTCHCSRGFQGRRCELKYVSEPQLSKKPPICHHGMAHFPCP